MLPQYARIHYRLWVLPAILAALALLPGCFGDISNGGGEGSGGDGGGGNTAPVADAGPDQNVGIGATVTLDGTGSTDPDSDLLFYSWDLESGPAGTSIATADLSDPALTRPQFTPDAVGAYRWILIVSDGTDESEADGVIIVVSEFGHSPPVADAGPDRNVKVGDLVTLNGFGSHDADLDELTYAWTLDSMPDDSDINLDSLSDPEDPAPSFTPDAEGTFVWELEVNDGEFDSEPDQVQIIATPIGVNAAPNANAGPDQSVTVGTLVTLNGSLSNDADGDVLNFSWTLTSKPGDSSLLTSDLSDNTDERPAFTPDSEGDFVWELIVSDGTEISGPDFVVITAQAPVSGGGSWSSAASMPTGRRTAAAAEDDGIIYVSGGENPNGTTLTTLEAYDVSGNSWTSKASMPSPRSSHCSASLNGIVYVIGGSASGTGSGRLDTMDAYDPDANNWSARAPMSVARSCESVAVNGYIYVVGGHNGTSAVNTVERYDPGSNSWETLSPMPVATSGHGIAAVGDLIYVFGGAGDVEYLGTLQIYDTTDDSWSTATPMPTARWMLSGSAVGGVVFAIGGYNPAAPDAPGRVEAFDPNSGEWTAKTTMPTARLTLTSTTVDGKIYAMGGNPPTGATILDTAEVFTP